MRHHRNRQRHSGGAPDHHEAARLADLVEFLKENEVIADYAQVTLLLHSVREVGAGPQDPKRRYVRTE